MQPKFEQIKKENSQLAQDYFDFIKASVADGSYFKDSLDWYFFRYVRCITDRTILIFSTILSFVVMLFLVQMVRGAFPLVEKVPIFVRAKDQSQFFPSLVYLKPKKDSPQGYRFDPNVKTVDEAISKYLLTVYVNDRESYDYSKAEINEVKKKLNRVRNLSSTDEYKKFESLMDKDNPTSPVQNFGKDVTRSIVIKQVNFIRSEEHSNFSDKLKNFLYEAPTTEAEIRFVVTTKTLEDGGAIKEEKADYVAKIKFNFSGARKSKSDKQLKNPTFNVEDYKLYKVQK